MSNDRKKGKPKKSRSVLLPEQQNPDGVSLNAVHPGGGREFAHPNAPTTSPTKVGSTQGKAKPKSPILFPTAQSNLPEKKGRGRPKKDVEKEKKLYGGRTKVEVLKQRKEWGKKSLQGPVEYLMKEVVVDKNGRPRQAGADTQEGSFVLRVKDTAEKHLYFFSKAILNRHFLTRTLHKPVCEFIQYIPPFHKLILMPREHAKTAIVSGGLPLHIIIQPRESNCYFPGMAGTECRILLAGETQDLAEKNLRVVESAHTTNQLFRAFWPNCCWENPKRQSKAWNQKALIFPRENEWPDPTIWAKGTDGAVTGSRPNVMIKDDLISIEAARSSTVMENAVDWHIASRALLDSYEKESGLQGLEFIIGTRWAVYDLYSHIIDTDPSVEIIDKKFHQIITNGKILWPEKHTVDSIEWLREYYKKNGMFYLLYMNNASDPSLVDFNLDMVRDFKFIKDHIIFERDESDDVIEHLLGAAGPAAALEEDSPMRDLYSNRGQLLTPDRLSQLSMKYEYIRARRN
jgi:hypothetical protein